MRCVLVTGGGGYVGSLLVPKLIKSGYRVRVFDWMFFDPHVFDPLAQEPHLEVIKGDLRDVYAIESALQGVDDVIHLACLSNDPSCAIDETVTRSINLDAGVQLIRRAKQNGVRRFLNASSASVYGIKEEENVTEESSLEPITSYAKYKAELEVILRSELSPSFSGVTVRPATLCGYAPRLRLDLTVNILTYQAICKGKITVFGGEQKRPNLVVQDMVDLYLLLLSVPVEKIHGEVFNVMAENYKVIAIANMVRETLGVPIAIEVVETNDLRSYHIAADKIKKVLGYAPKYSIRDAISEVGLALRSSRVNNPSSSKYRNVQFLTENFSIWARVEQQT